MTSRGVLSRKEIAIENSLRKLEDSLCERGGFPQAVEMSTAEAAKSFIRELGKLRGALGRGDEAAAKVAVESPPRVQARQGGVGLVFEGRWLSTNIARMSLYKNSLLLAMRQTRYQQLGTDTFEVSESPPSRLLSGYQSQLLDAVYSEFGKPINTDEFASQCCAVNMKIKPHVERILGTPALITIGAVRAFGVPVVPVLEPSLSAMAVSGDYHVWLTLPWLEVLDLTLLASIAKGKGAELSASRPLMGYPESFPDFEWSPWFVGSAAAMRLVTPAK